MLPTTWNEQTYKEYKEYLKSIAEEQYKVFQSKICFTKYEILGIRIPKLRQIAKSISKGDIINFLNINTYQYYEEIFIAGIVITNLKDEKLFNQFFSEFIKHIDNWAICDSFCNSLTIVEKNPEKYFKLALKLSKDKKEYKARVGLIIILSHFVQEPYLERIYNLLDEINSNQYYVNMAEAWLLCELYIKDKTRATKYLQKNNLNSFTQNKAISKIRDSYRVTKEEKDYLNTLKRK